MYGTRSLNCTNLSCMHSSQCWNCPVHSEESYYYKPVLNSFNICEKQQLLVVISHVRDDGDSSVRSMS